MLVALTQVNRYHFFKQEGSVRLILHGAFSLEALCFSVNTLNAEKTERSKTGLDGILRIGCVFWQLPVMCEVFSSGLGAVCLNVQVRACGGL